jgi:hypothetical protein
MSDPVNGTKRVVSKHPAEATGVAGALALLVAKALGVDDPDTIVALAIVVGFLPAAVTWLVELVRGRRADVGG